MNCGGSSVRRSRCARRGRASQLERVAQDRAWSKARRRGRAARRPASTGPAAASSPAVWLDVAGQPRQERDADHPGRGIASGCGVGAELVEVHRRALTPVSSLELATRQPLDVLPVVDESSGEGPPSLVRRAATPTSSTEDRPPDEASERTASAVRQTNGTRRCRHTLRLPAARQVPGLAQSSAARERPGGPRPASRAPARC